MWLPISIQIYMCNFPWIAKKINQCFYMKIVRLLDFGVSHSWVCISVISLRLVKSLLWAPVFLSEKQAVIDLLNGLLQGSSEVWHIKHLPRGLPWWRSGWESACQCRGHGFEPWSGKIPHAAKQQAPWATTIEPARLELVLRNKRGRNSKRPAHCNEEWPLLAATRESPCAETKTQHSQK